LKALVFAAQDRPEIVDREMPSIGPDEALIRSHAVGICHSDFELLEGRYIIPFRYPITPGHEWAGEVVEIGADVAGIRPGDRVVGECVVGPGGRDHFGFNISGAAAEYFKAKAEWLHVIPESMDYTQAALVEPFSVAYNAVTRVGGVDPSDTVAIIGSGPIGLLSLLAASANQARVVVIEPQPGRREVARKLGAADTLDPTTQDFPAAVSDVTSGRGFDAVIEAAGSPAAMALALDVAGHSGRLAFAGISVGATAPAALGLIQSKALRIQGLIGSMGLWPQTIRFIASGAVDPSRIVTATLPLAGATEALAAARDTKTNIKVHIRTAA
jgi:L-iditol 2-dehydrogenase